MSQIGRPKPSQNCDTQILQVSTNTLCNLTPNPNVVTYSLRSREVVSCLLFTIHLRICTIKEWHITPLIIPFVEIL